MQCSSPRGGHVTKQGQSESLPRTGIEKPWENVLFFLWVARVWFGGSPHPRESLFQDGGHREAKENPSSKPEGSGLGLSSVEPPSTFTHLLRLIWVGFQPLSLDRIMIQANPQPGLLSPSPITCLGACLWDSRRGIEGPQARLKREDLQLLSFLNALPLLGPPQVTTGFSDLHPHTSIQWPEHWAASSCCWRLGLPFVLLHGSNFISPPCILSWEAEWDHMFAFPLHDLTGLLVNHVKGLFWSADLLELTEHKRRLFQDRGYKHKSDSHVLRLCMRSAQLFSAWQQICPPQK